MSILWSTPDLEHYTYVCDICGKKTIHKHIERDDISISESYYYAFKSKLVCGDCWTTYKIEVREADIELALSEFRKKIVNDEWDIIMARYNNKEER